MTRPRVLTLSFPARLATLALATSQVQATCKYSPPPVPSQGQTADTLGSSRSVVAAEVGYGASASWWNADNLSDPEVNEGVVGVGRFRIGVHEDIDVGVVGGVGPTRAFVVGPEAKWRFARFAPRAAEGSPGFHAALISGIGVGAFDDATADPDERPLRCVFVAPYAGALASGGIEVVQMFFGLRVAASEAFGNDVGDLTVCPVLAFGVQLRPSRVVSFLVEGDLAAGLTTRDINDTAVIAYPAAGVSIMLDELFGSSASQARSPPSEGSSSSRARPAR